MSEPVVMVFPHGDTGITVFSQSLAVGFIVLSPKNCQGYEIGPAEIIYRVATKGGTNLVCKEERQNIYGEQFWCTDYPAKAITARQLLMEAGQYALAEELKAFHKEITEMLVKGEKV
jgi:hypothetical protein